MATADDIRAKMSVDSLNMALAYIESLKSDQELCCLIRFTSNHTIWTSNKILSSTCFCLHHFCRIFRLFGKVCITNLYV